MRFDVLTLFPQMFEAVLGDSIIGRARENGLIELNFIDIRDFSANKHRKVDDYPYSGGGGMLMNAQPVFDAYSRLQYICRLRVKYLDNLSRWNCQRRSILLFYAVIMRA